MLDKRENASRRGGSERHPGSTPTRVLLASCLVMIALHTWGAIKPLHENWGVHSFAFYPAWLSILALVLSMLILLPGVRSAIVRRAGKIAQSSSRLPTPILFLLLGGATMGLSLLFPARINLLGDSDLILSLTPENPGVQDISANFRNQPLTYYALRTVQYILGGGTPVEVGYTYQILDDVAGLLFIFLLLLFLHYLKVSSLEKLLIGGYLFFQTSLQFFFGYVENYALFSVLTAAFVITGWLALEGNLHPIFAILLFAIMIGLHLGSLIFFPAPLILLTQSWRERKLQTGLMGAAGIAVSTLFFHWSGYSLEQFIRRMQAGVQIDMLPILSSPPGGPYAMFSALHMIDWTNACLFLVSFGCFIAPVLVYVYVREIPWRTPLVIFLFTVSACGFAFTFIFNSALGMARDWDLLVTFMLPVNFFVVYLLLRYFRGSRESYQVLAVVVILNALRVAAWVGINADPDRHLQRAEILTEEGLSGTFPVIYYEALGKVFWHRNDFQRSRIWYERYLTIDSLNPRILGNLAADYDKLQMRDKYFETLTRAARSGSKELAIYLNLGNELVRRGDTAAGVDMYRRTLAADSMTPEADANLALIYMSQHNYSLAAFHSARAIGLGMREPVLYRCAAFAYFANNDAVKSLEYLDTYLSMAPGDEASQRLRRQLMQKSGRSGG